MALPKPEYMTIKDVKFLLDAFEGFEDKMSEWERDEFIPSVTEQFQNGSNLSVRQREILVGMYDRLF